jgi:allantoicase
MSNTTDLAFVGLVNLASESLGAKALATNDDFFAGMENLVKDAPAVFLPDEFTDRGKWMDGWESRRKRVDGHDWCIVRLGAAGVIRAIDIDTSHFLGNQPPFASVEATNSTDDAIDGATWTEVVAQGPCRPGSMNLFSVSDSASYTHLRLNLYPDGGVARLRVYGEVTPNWDASAEVDLAALAHGGMALACSDAFFGPMNNLISPGRAVNMGGGWETRRRQGRPFDSRPDWIMIRLGAAGTISGVEVDTNHFKGNIPDRCALDGVNLPGARITDLLASDAWETFLPEQKLRAHEQHMYREELSAKGPYTHVRLSIFPDGGISRLRVLGHRSAGKSS